MMKRSHGRRHGHSSQRGNAMLFALLALIIMGLTAATTLQSRRVEMKRAAGVAEATVLEKLRNGLQSAMYDQFNALQQGLPLTKGGTSVAVGEEAGHRVWRPTVAQLRDMGYLPEGWTTERSALNDGPYSISLRTIPSGCAPVNCDVEAHVVVMRPFLDEGRGSAVDGVTIGPILTKTGADGGVSLATRPGVISGFNNAWTLPNPVPGQPAGVVALRIGTESAGFNQFVRMGDLRDPALRGDFSASGDVHVGGSVSVGAGVSAGGAVTVRGADGQPCLTLNPTGAVTLGCESSLTASVARLVDGTGSETTLTPGEVRTTGVVSAERGVQAGGATLFGDDDPSGIRLAGPDLHITGSNGNLVAFSDGTARFAGAMGGASVGFTTAVQEGSACDSTSASSFVGRIAVTLNNSLATCINGQWKPTHRWGQAGGECNSNGASATDINDGQALICRGGLQLRAASLISNFALIETRALQFSSAPIRITKPICDNNGGVHSEPLVVIIPNNEDPVMQGPSIATGVNRFALDRGDEWELYLERASDRSILPGNVVALIYCFYETS